MNYLQRLLVGALAILLATAQPSAAFFYSTSLKNTRMDAITTAIGTSGLMKMYTVGGGATACSGTLLVTNALSATAAAAASGGVLTFNAISNGTAVAGSGTAAICATITTSGGTVVVDGLTVGTSGTNVVLNSNLISSGQTVSITSATLTHG